MSSNRFRSFSEFYEFYLREHSRPLTRVVHCVGSLCFLIGLGLGSFWWPAILLSVFIAYGMAWGSHFFLEKNTPATFKKPLFSLLGDFRILYDLVTGRIAFDSHSTTR